MKINTAFLIFYTILFTIVLNAQNYNENFDSTTLPSNITIINPNNDAAAWEHTTSVSSFAVGTGAVVIDNYTEDTRNTADWLLLPEITLGTNAIIQFDVAYARYNQNLCDTLVLAVATSQSTTYAVIFQKSCSDLATAPDTTSQFVPDATQWRTESVMLNAYAGNTVRIAFINSGGWGQNLYIDNVQIQMETLSTTQQNSNDSYKLWPNPAQNIVYVSNIEEGTPFVIYNNLGKKVQMGSVKNNNAIDLINLSPGLYFLKPENLPALNFIIK
jgi:hypothetical protein